MQTQIDFGADVHLLMSFVSDSTIGEGAHKVMAAKGILALLTGKPARTMNYSGICMYEYVCLRVNGEVGLYADTVLRAESRLATACVAELARWIPVLLEELRQLSTTDPALAGLIEKLLYLCAARGSPLTAPVRLLCARAIAQRLC